MIDNEQVPANPDISEAAPEVQLSIICVNWNSTQYLRECIASIYQHTHNLKFEIIVVDNASPQRDVDTLLDVFPDVRIVKIPINAGFAAANNLGARHSTGRYLLFLNPDTRLVSPAINMLVSAISPISDAGIVGCKLLNSDLTIQTESIQTFPTILNQVLDVEYLRLKWPRGRLWQIAPLFGPSLGPERVEVISGACQLLRREIFEAAGGYSEDYFMYAEDIDLNYRLARMGYHNYYVGKAIIVHHGGRSSGQHQASQWSTVMKFRAMVRFYQKTRGRSYAVLYRAAMAFVAIGRLAVLGAAAPFAIAGNKHRRIRSASAKWWTVLRCAAWPGQLGAST